MLITGAAVARVPGVARLTRRRVALQGFCRRVELVLLNQEPRLETDGAVAQGDLVVVLAKQRDREVCQRDEKTAVCGPVGVAPVLLAAILGGRLLKS